MVIFTFYRINWHTRNFGKFRRSAPGKISLEMLADNPRYEHQKRVFGTNE